MRTPIADNLDSGNLPRDRCYDCFRPKNACFCAAIPTIDNRTEVLIVQHVRERFHPFNTARIVRKALRNSSLLVDQTARLADRLQLRPHAGLLYPDPQATLIADVPAAQRPEQLVVVDGTWHQVKTLVREIKALHDLPRYQLLPPAPSRYRLRREPNATSLSTLEATVAALRVLEPDTVGLDQLLAAFDTMVERQLAHPKVADGWRSKDTRDRTFKNIPLGLLGDLRQVVVAYGESAAGIPGGERVPRYPVFWVAERLGTGERFACAIQPEQPLEDGFLGHLQLTRAHFSGAVTPDEFRRSWAAFQQPEDTLVVYSASTARLLTTIAAGGSHCVILKSVDFHPQRRYGTLDEVLAGEGLLSTPSQHPGRAGQRLANLRALVQYLREIGLTKPGRQDTAFV